MTRALLLVVALGACRGTSAAPSPMVLEVALTLEGADAPTIEASVVEPVEQAASAVPGVKSIESRIEADHATVRFELAPRADLDRTAHELQHVLATIQPRLPSELAPPLVRRHVDEPVMWLAVTGTLPIGELSARVFEVVKPALERLPGVASIELRGLAEPTVIVRPDPARLSAAGVTVFDVIAALQSAEMPAGLVEADREATAPIGDVVVRQPVRVRDLATVEVGFERTKHAPAIAIHAHPQADRDVVTKTVRNALAGFSEVELVERPIVTKKPALVASLRGPELAVLGRAADAIADELASAKIEVERDPPVGGPERTYATDRQQMARLGIPMADVAATLRAFAGAHAGTLVAGGESRDIVVRVPLEAFEQLAVRTQQGTLVPIANVVTATLGTSETILRRDRERAVTLSIDGNASAARAILGKHELPPGYRVVFGP